VRDERESKREREVSRERERNKVRERHREYDRGRGRGIERVRTWESEKHHPREYKLHHKDLGDRLRGRASLRANSSWTRRWRSTDRKEKPTVGMHFNNCGWDNAGDDEGVWTKVISKKIAKGLKKTLKADHQTQHIVARGKPTRYHINWRDKDDITSYYFTHFPDKADEELLWKHFKKWGDVREVYIAKRRNREGQRYGFVRFKGVSDTKGLEVKLDNIFINEHKLFVNLPRFMRTARIEGMQQNTAIGRNLINTSPKLCDAPTDPYRRSYVEVMTMGKLSGDNRSNETVVPSIMLTPYAGRGLWCKDAWVGKLKEIMAVETLEDRIAWELGYNVRTRFLGDDMILLSGVTDEKAQLIIQTEKDSGNSLFYSLEKWRPGCRPNNRVVWIQVWGFPLEVWEVEHFKKAISFIGDVIELDDDTEDRRRLDRARILVRTPLPPSIRREVAVRVGEFKYRVWFVEETGAHGGTKQKGLAPSDDWSEEIPSDDGGDIGDADDDKDTNLSFSPELSNKSGFRNN